MNDAAPGGWLRRKGRKGWLLLTELLRGNPDGLLRVLAERAIPRLERHRNRFWADHLRIALLACQPGLRAARKEREALLLRTQLLLPPGWSPERRERQRLRHRLAARMLRSGAAIVTCDDWVATGEAGWSWRQKPLWDGPFDGEVGIGEGPVLVRQELAATAADAAGGAASASWRRMLHQRAMERGGHAHVPLPLLRAPRPRPAAAVPPAPTAALPPLVSVLIPTGGSRRRLAGREEILVRHCLRTLLQRSRHRNLELVVIDGGELADDLIGELARLVERHLGGDRWRFLRATTPYDYTSRINQAAAAARGELLLQLNDDTELLDPDGVSALVEALEGPAVGIAGALLLYPDGRVQHAGTAIDNLAPRHVWAGCRPQELPWGTLLGHRTFHAVTGAVCLCRRSLWDRLGGFSDRFPVNYGDVDFCLRAGELGLRTVLAPRSRWIHHESASRPVETVPPELSTFAAIWGERLGGAFNVDPYCSAWRLLLAPPPRLRS